VQNTDSIVQRSLEYLKEFEEHGLANVEEPDLGGWDLHRAAKENRSDIARALLVVQRSMRGTKRAKHPCTISAYKNRLRIV
jgi:hypothetical protein